jgi:hypothetical protein
VSDCAGDRGLDGCTESHESVGYNDFEGQAEYAADTDFDHCREVVGSIDVEDHGDFVGFAGVDGCGEDSVEDGKAGCDDCTELSDQPSYDEEDACSGDSECAGCVDHVFAGGLRVAVCVALSRRLNTQQYVAGGRCQIIFPIFSNHFAASRRVA